MPLDSNPAMYKHLDSRGGQSGKLGSAPLMWDSGPFQGFPHMISDVRQAAQRMIVYKSADLSVELHVRISHTDADLGEELMCWDCLSSSERESVSPTIDVGIYSYRHFIITVIQKAQSVADPEMTRMAVLTVLQRVSGNGNLLI